MRNWLHGLGLAIQYFSRIPLPLSLNFNEETVKRSIFFLPLIGWIIGIILYFFNQLLAAFFPVPLLSVILVTLLLWLSGALHADGWMDVWDGIGSGREKERMLTIMKDSRVGAMGVVGFVILFAIKTTSLIELNASPFIIEVLLVTPLIARWGVLPSIYLFPYAREKGMGLLFKQLLSWKILLLSIVWLLPIIWLSSYFFLMFFVVIIFVIISGVYFTGKLDGLTGDIYGWLIEGSEALLWLIFVVINY